VEVSGVAPRIPVREQLLRTLATAAVAPCYEAALGRDPRLYGELVVELSIQADGRVVDASARLSTLGDAEAEACTLGAVRALSFPGVTQGTLTVVYPFVFTSDATPPEVARALKQRYGLLPPESDERMVDPRDDAPPGVVYLW
jgi:hypothetical protein